MRARLVLLFLLTTSASLAQQWSHYRSVTLDSIYKQWDETTRAYSPGVSVMQPQKVRFVARYVAAPAPCNNGQLRSIFTMHGMGAALDQVAITHCITLSSRSGRALTAYIQDSLVPGVIADARLGGELDIYADLLAYNVTEPRDRNSPVMLVNRFEPR